MCSEPGIEGILLKDRNPLPEASFQILIATNFSLERSSKC